MMDAYTGLTFAGTQTLAGSGTVSAQYGSGIGLSGTSQTLTIAAGITFKSSGSGLNVGANTLINEGTLSGDTSVGPGGGSLTVNGTNWVNDGTIEAINGGPVSLSGSWSNSGTISLNGNTVNLGGAITPATLGTVSRDATNPGVLNLVGTLNLGSQTLNSSIGPLTLAGGTINGGTISDTILASYGTLNDVTVSGLLHIVGGLSVTDTASTGAGLTLASGGSVMMDAYTGLTFAGTQTLAGSGTVSAQYGSGIGLSGTSQTLTIAAGITFKSSGSGLNVGANTLINEGTLSGDTSVGPGGGSLTINGTNWVNDGTIEAINGGPVSLSGSWTNSGVISLNGNTVNLGGVITPATLGTVSRDATNPGVLNLVGTLNLGGGTLDSSIGPLTLAGGTINGGTVSDTILASYGGTLNDVTVSGLLHIVGGLSVTDTAGTGAGLTLASGGSVMMDAYTGLAFAGTQTLAGSGTVSAQYGSGIGLSGTDQTLTIAAGIAFKSSGSTLNVGANTLVNQGTLSGDASVGPGGGSLTVNGTNWVNDGTVEAINGGSVSLSGSWSNSGTISLNGNTVNLGGTITLASLGTVSRDATNPGVLNLVGTLNLGGGTLDSSIGPLTLAGGTINGGTVSDTILASYGGTLNDVTVSGLLHIVGGLSVTDTAGTGAGLTLASGGSVMMDAYTGLAFAGTQTLAGSGTVSAQYGSGIGLSGTDQTLTIAAGIAFKSSGSTLNVGANTLVNQGTLSGDASVGPGGGSLTVNGTNWVNDGTVEAINGGSVSLSGSWTNSGTIAVANGTLTASASPTNFSAGTLTGGTWKITSPGTLRVPFGSSIVTNAATILLDGSAAGFYIDTGTTPALSGFTTNTASGSFTIQNGATFSSAGAFSNAGSVIIGSGSSFSPDGNYTQTAGSTVLSGGTLGTSSPATTINLQGGSLAGWGTINGNLTNSADLSPSATNGALTVSGYYSQTTTGRLDVNLAGTAAGQYSQLDVQGSASLDGALNVTVATGLIATTGTKFPIVTAASVTGQFATATGLSSSALFLKTIYDSADVTLTTKAAPAIQITPTSGLVTSQAGATAAFTAVLTSQHTDSVSFGVSSSNTNAGTVSTSQLTFTTTNWNVAQTVTITGVNDLMAEANVAYTIVMAPAVSADPAYAGFQPASVAVVNLSTDVAGFTVSPTSGLVTTSTGGSASFSVVLSSKPAAEVDLPLSSSNTSQGTVSTSKLVFTPTNWNQPHTVTITGVANSQYSGNVAFHIVFAASSSADPNYNSVVVASVSVTNINPAPDLEVANLKVTPATGVQSGNALSVQWNDTNAGTGSVTASFTDSIVVTNTTIGQTLGSGTVTYNEGTAGPIVPGASPAMQFAFTLPDAVAGTGQIQFTVTTNAGNTVVESNPGGTASTNNTASVTVASTLASYPDLQVTNLAVAAPSGMIAGGTYALSWDDANSGAAATPAGTSWSDQVTITNTTTGTTLANVSVPYNAAVSASGPIPAGGAHLQQYSFTLPGGTAGTGQIQFSVVANANHAVFEYNSGGTATSNNSASITQTAALGNYPDLQVTGLSVSPSSGLQSGGSLTVNWSDSNTGTAAAGTSWVDSLVIQNMTTGQTLGSVTLPYGIGATSHAPLAAGQAVARQYMYALPDGAAGVGQIAATVIVNSTSSLFEYNTAGTGFSNDTAAVQVNSAIAAYPDLQVQNLGMSPASIYSGASLVLHWQDANTGNGTVSSSWDDRVIVTNTTTGQTLLTSTLVYDVTKLGALAGGGAGNQQVSITLPAGSSSVGTLQFSVTTDVLNQVFEYNSGGTAETNNTLAISAVSGLAPAADLEVSGMAATPSSGLQSGGSVVLSWNDANQGNAAATGSWVDAVTATNQGTGATIFTATVPYDGSASGKGPLGSGGSASQQELIPIPQGDAGAGQLVFKVVTDSTRTIPDYTELRGG